jgi:hypothetical protein
MDCDMAAAAQGRGFALPSRFLQHRERLAQFVLERADVMHLERPIGVAARFASAGVEAGDEVVAALRQARADRDVVHGRPMPGRKLKMLQPPQRQDTGFATDHASDAIVRSQPQMLLGF